MLSGFASAFCDAKGSGLRWITKEGEPAVGDAQISTDGSVYYSVEHRGGEPLRRLDVRTGSVVYSFDSSLE